MLYRGTVLALLIAALAGAQEKDTMQERIAAARALAAEVSARTIVGVTAFDRDKTVGIALRLVERAEQTLADTLPPARFPWVRDGFTSPEDMVGQAEGYLRALADGTDSLAGKFCEPGGCTVDHALIKRNGEHHLIYIRGTAASHWPESPSDDFGHATSTDLVHWNVHPPVLKSPKPGWDEFQVWAPHIIEHQGEYWMLYTGVNDNCCQAVGLARSKDLYQWERHPENPVITTGDWGHWDTNVWSDCRDPMVLKDGDTFYCYYTATRHTGATPALESCVGVSSSKDLIHWQDEGYIRLDKSLTTPPESPFCVKRGGKYYLFYTNYGLGTVLAVSDDPVKGFTYPEAFQVLPEASASEIHQDGDDWYISLISHAPNALHFFEIRRLLWAPDGTVSAAPLAE